MGLNRMIDHTILEVGVSKGAVMQVIEETKKYHFYPACISPVWVALAKEQLQDKPIAVYTTIGFPLGTNTPEIKVFETIDAISNGVDEADTIVNVDALRLKDDRQIQEGIEAVVEAAKGCMPVKVTIGTSLLDREETIRVCGIAKTAGADFVKTSTGFSAGRAKVEDVRLMREIAEPEMGVKASGGIRNEEEAMAMTEAGATRIGTSAGMTIVSGSTSEGC